MNDETFSNGMAILREAFPARMREINPKIYFSELQDISDVRFISAVKDLIRKHKELYPDSNLMGLIREYAEGGKLNDRATLAWETAIETAKKYDYYFTISFEDKIINGVIRAMGGWESFSTMPVKDQPFARKEFIQLYEAYSRVGRACPEKLEGNLEKVNLIPERVKLIKSDYLQDTVKQIENGV